MASDLYEERVLVTFRAPEGVREVALFALDKATRIEVELTEHWSEIPDLLHP